MERMRVLGRCGCTAQPGVRLPQAAFAMLTPRCRASVPARLPTPIVLEERAHTSLVRDHPYSRWRRASAVSGPRAFRTDDPVTNDTISTEPSTRHSLDNFPTDARLPQLPILLDPAAMQERLQDHLFRPTDRCTPVVIRCCEILQVRYTPHSSCLVSYRLTIENPETGEQEEQILCGRAFPKGRSRAYWKKTGRRLLVRPRFGTPLIHLPDIEMVLWCLSNDPTMPTLPAALDVAHRPSPFLLERLAADLGPGWHGVNTTSQVVHYVGAHTCTVRTAIEWSHPATNCRHTSTIYGTTYADNAGVQTARVMRHLWNSDARRNGQFGMAQPVRYDARLKTLWQRGIHGTPLEHCPLDRWDCIPRLVQTAQALAALHAIPLSQIRSNTRSTLLAKLNTVGALLMRCRPACRPVLLPLLIRLMAQARTMPARVTATLHGDLHLKNLILTERTIAVLDLGTVCKGRPCQDLGRVIAGFLTWGVAHQRSVSQLAHHALIFVDQYNQVAPWTVGKAVVAWYTAMALVTECASRCVTHLHDGRFGMLEPLLHLADEISTTRSLDSVAYRRTDARRWFRAPTR